MFEPQGFASLQLETGECPLERLVRLVALRHEGVVTQAQLLDGRMTGVAQDAAGIDAEQQLDQVDPAGVDGGEMEDEPVMVPGVEIVPHGLRATGVQVFSSAAQLESTLLHYASTYNNNIPQRALRHRSPIQALKTWQANRPDLFVKGVYENAGRDT